MSDSGINCVACDSAKVEPALYHCKMCGALFSKLQIISHLSLDFLRKRYDHIGTSIYGQNGQWHIKVCPVCKCDSFPWIPQVKLGAFEAATEPIMWKCLDCGLVCSEVYEWFWDGTEDDDPLYEDNLDDQEVQ